MSWIKLDDQWMDHPKIVAAGRDARDIWLASLTYCAKHLTDGYFHPNLLPALAVSAGVDVANCQTFARTLLEVGLWEMVDGVYHIHDYLDYNPSKEQANATKTARAEAGRRGARAKHGKSLANSQANAMTNSWQNSAPSPSPSPSLKREEEGAAAASFSDDPQLESIFQQVTGMITIPGTARENSLGTLRTIRSMKGSDLETVEYLRGFFLAWKNRNYNLSNLGWLNDWAVSGEIPAHKKPEPPAVRTRKLTDARGNVIEVPA